MSRLIDFDLYPIKLTLKKLLQDKTTKKNIIWATNTFEHFGREFDDKSEITEIIFQSGFRLMPRVLKSQEAQLDRTRKKAEVFTPGWIVNEMNNYMDQEWFQRKDVFNIEKGETWEAVREKINFPEGKNWKKYILSRRLEITCGEAPYLVSRYDVSTGEKIEIINRIGILDRKLRVVNENTWTKDEWIKWATRAIESTYGFEYQGDNLLIARVNILMTFVEYFEDRWKEEVDKKTLLHLANIISWNIWQMDGLTDMVPFGAAKEDIRQMNFFDLLSGGLEEEDGEETTYCRIKDWRGNKSYLFIDYKEKEMKKFDFVIGNPPFDKSNDENGRNEPLYHIFMDEAFKVGKCVELIHPARFLFDAGQTPKAWNRKMLNDPHFKVLSYEKDSFNVFPTLRNTIKGGIAISIKNNSINYGPVIRYTPNELLNDILHRVINSEKSFLSEEISPRGCYRVTDDFFKDFPSAKSSLGKGTGNMIASNFFEKVPEVFEKNGDVENSKDFIEMLCRIKGTRKIVRVKEKYIIKNDYLNSYNVAIPKSNGTGIFGEILSESEILIPRRGSTDTFINICKLNKREEAIALKNYLKTKFLRAMLGIKKVTQDNPRGAWSFVPMQDFTNKSDIDWSKSIPEIDRQLYAKYNLSQEEIDFIEKNVKEME